MCLPGSLASQNAYLRGWGQHARGAGMRRTEAQEACTGPRGLASLLNIGGDGASSGPSPCVLVLSRLCQQSRAWSCWRGCLLYGRYQPTL